ncbi:DUF3187 family protein [Stenotrophobium rhamnosiphilum]|uniref:DUF3187 family protein n=1 Tax=Stenotrophobium rhamnosiphilum TaxID=2029166 RepID=UPI001375197A|nr:DUF3187 family protein [Stenotrophobium rhamnosiphilum]
MTSKRILNRTARLAVLAAISCSSNVYAWDALPAYNQGTLARSFALPAIGQSSVLGASQSSFSADYDLTTEYYVDSSLNESITIDGETSAFALSWRQGIGNNLELSARLPVLIVGGGFMDHFIDQWHKTFGLPDGGRPLAASDVRQISYVVNGNPVLDVQQSGTTLGDIELAAGWKVGEGAALRGMVKLPTGSDSKLTGGNWGGALWGDFALPFDAGSSWDGFASLGATVAQKADALKDQQRNAAIFGGVGLGYFVTQNFELRSQLYAHSALYKNSELDSLKKPGLQLTMGGTYRWSPKVSMDVFFQEDPVTYSSPDFSLHVGVTVR